MSKEINKKNNPCRKIPRTFSFAFEDGYEALAYLDEVGKTVVGGKSGYLVKLLLQDKRMKQSR